MCSLLKCSFSWWNSVGVGIFVAMKMNLFIIICPPSLTGGDQLWCKWRAQLLRAFKPQLQNRHKVDWTRAAGAQNQPGHASTCTRETHSQKSRGCRKWGNWRWGWWTVLAEFAQPISVARAGQASVKAWPSFKLFKSIFHHFNVISLCLEKFRQW